MTSIVHTIVFKIWHPKSDAKFWVQKGGEIFWLGWGKKGDQNCSKILGRGPKHLHTLINPQPIKAYHTISLTLLQIEGGALCEQNNPCILSQGIK